MITHGADVSVAGSSTLAFAAQEATKTVPIVIRAAADPVAARLVASLARPGGNITGVTSQAADLSAKRLELLKQLLPQLHRVAILFEPNAAASRDSMRGRVGAFDDLVNVRCSPLVQQREIGGDGYQAASRDSVPAAGH